MNKMLVFSWKALKKDWGRMKKDNISYHVLDFKWEEGLLSGGGGKERKDRESIEMNSSHLKSRT
jgi:hypothetical protein